MLNPLLLEKGIKSLLGVPLAVREHIIGVLHVGTLTPRLFTRDDTELLQLVAERLAVAIEKARIHDEMIALDELKLSFVAVASHELRTPATAVYGILTTLRERGARSATEVRRQLEQTAWEQADRMRRLIEQLLDLRGSTRTRSRSTLSPSSCARCWKRSPRRPHRARSTSTSIRGWR